jgi:hypothetical protein
MTNEHPFLWLAPTEWIAILTFVLAAAAIIQVVIYTATHHTTKVIERAYVDISQADEPWLLRSPHIRIVLKNHGRTPADIENFIVRFRVWRGTLPSIPMYDDAGPEAHVLLMPGGTMNFGLPNPLTESDDAAVGSKSADLYLIGYVDYWGRFGAKHRGGYARRFSRDQRGTFSFVVEPGYNYDIEIDEQGNQRKDVSQSWRHHKRNLGLT